MKRTPLKRKTGLARGGTLSRGTRMNPISRKRRAGKRDFDAVYRQVDARSKGICEVHLNHKAEEHQHLRKPRLTFHEPQWILHICREAHLEFEPRAWSDGRRVASDFDGEKYLTMIVVARDTNEAMARYPWLPQWGWHKGRAR